MNTLKSLTRSQKYFILIFITGLLGKYNYLLLRIFHVPSITGLILKNILLILFIIYFLLPAVKNKRGRMILFILLITFTVFFKGNYWYNNYFGGYLSFNDIVMGEGINPFYVLIRQIMNFYDIIFIFDIILLGYLLVRGRNNIDRKFKVQKFAGRDLYIVILLVLLLAAQMVTTNLLLGNDSPLELYRRSTSAFVNVYGVIPLYFFEFYILKYGNLQEPGREVLADDGLSETENVDSGLNIIVIQVESLDANLIDYKFNGREITPFLNKLKEQSLFFTDIYSQHVNGSFDAEFSLLTSLYPVNRNYAFKVNNMKYFDSLVRLLKNSGYHTLAFHGNDKTFFNRNQAFPDLGFDRFYSREDFSARKRIMDIEESYLGINDYDFFKQSRDYLEKAETPFFAFMITLTSHTPFNFYPQDEAIEAYEDIEDPLVRDYFNSISFVDKSLEMFFSELEKMGLINDTVFVIYADHAAGIEEDSYTSGRKFVNRRNSKEPEHIPLLIVHPDFEPGIFDKTGTITDIGPTLLEMIGASKEPASFAGKSLLQEGEEPVLFIHEIPQVLYKDQLFVLETDVPGGLDEFIKVGYLKDRSKKKVNLSRSQQERLLKTIKSMREIMFQKHLIDY